MSGRPIVLAILATGVALVVAGVLLGPHVDASGHGGSPGRSATSPSPSSPSPSVAPSVSLASRAPAARAAATVTIVAAGDIACDPSAGTFNGGRGTTSECRQASTAREIGRLRPDRVLALGDLQYDVGALRAFRHSYGPSWGRFRAKTRPAVGNHEYGQPNARGYFRYFRGLAGPRGRGWYSYNLGAWHLIALNSNCDILSCRPGSAEFRWLKKDLTKHRTSCTLAYFHHPRFSSGPHGDNTMVSPLWGLLRRAGTDVVLNGHDHIYERFHPMNANGSPGRNGIRTFTVGTGGESHYWIVHVHRGSAVRNATTFGVLQMWLSPGSYRWRFVPIGHHGGFTDAGHSACQGQPLG